MRHFVITLASTLLLATLCIAQDVAPTSDQGASLAAAAQASRSRVQEKEAKQADIRKLLQLIGAGNIATQTMSQMEKGKKPLIANALPPGDYRDKLVD